MKILDIVIFIAYILGITIFGGSFFKKNKTSSAFTTGNSQIPRWVVTMSIFATFVSAISYLALPGKSYQSNWNALVFSLSIPIASIIAVYFFVPLYRKINSPSAYTFLEERFGPWAKNYVSICYLLTQLMRVGSILYLMGMAINTVFNWNLPDNIGIALIIIITGVLVVLYSMLGGIQAVVWTDAIQGIILIAGAIVCVVFLLFNMPGGAEQLFTIAKENHKFSLGSFGAQLNQSTFWVVLLYGLIINLQNFGIDQNYVQRYMASKTDKDAKRSAFWGGMIYLPVSVLFFFIGTALFSYYSSGTASMPEEYLAASKADRIFPYFIVNELPAGISGLLIASIFAAGMSTISTSFNSTATVFLTDFYQKYFKKDASDKDSMKVLYISSVVVGVLGIGIGLAMIGVKSALDTWWKLASIFSGGMLGLFLLAMTSFVKKKIAAVIAVAVGVIVILFLAIGALDAFDNFTEKYIHNNLYIVLGTVLIFITGFFISWLMNTKKR